MEFRSPSPLSASQGGEPVPLDDPSVPGKVVHENGATSGTIDVLKNINVRNQNAATQSIWWTIQGGTIPVPQSRAEMRRIGFAGTGEAKIPPVDIIPDVFVIKPGYSLLVSADVSGNPLEFCGTIDKYGAGGIYGYGGLIQRADVAMADIAAGNWATVPFDSGQVTNPINVVQDFANNRLQLNSTGVWFVTLHASLTVTKENNDRVLYLRTFNETKGVAYSPNPFPLNIENQANASSLSASLLAEVDDSIVGDYFRWELGGSADAFAGITLQKAGVLPILIDPNAYGA